MNAGEVLKTERAETAGERPRTIVAVGGFTSDSGKTTLVCELLRALRGWEAIKMTRGHYRSCGKDPQACCVSPLLGDEPVVRTGREATYSPGKDTGRYWDAGASEVHWAIVTSAQVESGIGRALERVRSEGVIVEGNSFLDFVRADFVVLAASVEKLSIKSSARRALPRADALYLTSGGRTVAPYERERFERWMEGRGFAEHLARLPVYTDENRAELIERIVVGAHERRTLG